MVQQQQKRGIFRFGGGWIFLLVMMAPYALAGVFDPEALQVAWSSFQSLAARVIPALAAVFLLIFLFNMFAEPKWLGRYVDEEWGLVGWPIAIGAGILSLGPIYPWYVLLGDLRAKGMRTSLAAAFLYARAIKIPLLPLLVHYFGMGYTVTLVLYLLLFAVLTGMLTGLIARDADHVDSAS